MYKRDIVDYINISIQQMPVRFGFSRSDGPEKPERPESNDIDEHETMLGADAFVSIPFVETSPAPPPSDHPFTEALERLGIDISFLK